MSIQVPENFYRQTITRAVTLTGATNIYVSAHPSPSEGYITISPASSTLREIIYYTAKGTDGNGTYLTVTLANRGLGGTTAQTHAIGEPVRMNVTAQTIQDISDAMDAIVAAGAHDASTTVKGLSKLSVAPASAANPIAVGDNDTRVPTAIIATSAGAADTGKVPKVNASGVLDTTFIQPFWVKSFTAGEDIAAKDAVYMSSGESVTTEISATTGDSVICEGASWAGQTFITAADTYYVTGITFRTASSSGEYLTTVTASIRATSGGLPTGADIGSITGTNSQAKSNNTEYSITFSSPVPVSPSTTYAVVLRNPASGNNGYLMCSASSSYANGTLVTSGDSGANWSTATKDLYLDVVEVRIASGQIGKAVDNGTTRETGFIGFAESAISRTASGNVIIGGYVTGVTTGSGAVVTLSDTPGAITTGNTKKIGIGISATELIIANQL